MSELEQGSTEWLAMRQRYIGASDSPILMGVNKFKLPDGRYKTPYLLWKEKLGLEKFNFSTSATNYGKMMEDPAREEYIRLTGINMRPAVVFHPEIKYLMSSLDGISDDGDLALEIKNCCQEDHDVARRGEVPLHYYPQVQHQLVCTGHDIMHYFSMHKGEGILVIVQRDDDYIKKMLKKQAEFWDCVQNLKEPELTDLDFKEMSLDWEEKAHMLWELQESVRINEKLISELKEELICLSAGVNSRSGLYRMICSTRKGSIDYSSIPELKNINIENYRKPSSTIWSLKKN